MTGPKPGPWLTYSDDILPWPLGRQITVQVGNLYQWTNPDAPFYCGPASVAGDGVAHALLEPGGLVEPAN